MILQSLKKSRICCPVSQAADVEHSPLKDLSRHFQSLAFDVGRAPDFLAHSVGILARLVQRTCSSNKPSRSNGSASHQRRWSLLAHYFKVAYFTSRTAPLVCIPWRTWKDKSVLSRYQNITLNRLSSRYGHPIPPQSQHAHRTLSALVMFSVDIHPGEYKNSHHRSGLISALRRRDRSETAPTGRPKYESLHSWL